LPHLHHAAAALAQIAKADTSCCRTHANWLDWPDMAPKGQHQPMTALRKYERLESSGLWREAPEARLREVIVALRATTLILADPKTEVPLTQWSLPALYRLNPNQMPALFAPSEDEGESLEIDDADMAAALETVRYTLERRRAKPGRLRGSLYAGTALVCLGLAVFWLPGALVDYTANMLPLPTLGQLALQDLSRLTGSACADPAGQTAASALAKRIDPNDPPQIKVLRDTLIRPTALPGGIVLLPAKLMDQSDGPEAVAGYVLTEKRYAFGRDPTKSLLRYAGLWATLRLLTSGAMAPNSIAGYGETLLTAAEDLPEDAELISSFKTAGISTTPYALARDPSGQQTAALIQGDPLPRGSNPVVLDDGSWLSLQAICQ
jgi:hypothetical protein